MASRNDGTGSGRPLDSLRIVVTRPLDQAGVLIRRLERLGAEAIAFPVLEIVPPKDWAPLDAALQNLALFDWVVFGSVNAVRIVFDRHAALGLDRGTWHRPSVAAVGEATMAALLERQVPVALVPQQTDAEGVVAAMGERGVRGQAVLLPQARQGRPVLEEGLRRLGAKVTRVDAYESKIFVPSPRDVRALLARGWDGLAFTSPSTVRHFDRIIKEVGGDPTRAPAFCIGNVTEKEARARGFEVGGVAARASVDDLVEVMAAYFAANRNRQ